jgi:hypothetical protein
MASPASLIANGDVVSRTTLAALLYVLGKDQSRE